MENELAKVEDDLKALSVRTEDLIDKKNVFNQIMTRGADSGANSLVDFKIFDKEKLALIAKRMPEINRASTVFGRQNSQTTGKLMSLNMISQSPYRRLKQCLAKIERKRGALKENIFKLRKEKVKMDRLLLKRDKIKAAIEETARIYSSEVNIDSKVVQTDQLPFDLEEIEIKIEQKAANIADTNIYIEGALKEIGMYQDAYDEICESYNIPEKWDERDMEEAEIREHVETAFLHLVRDLEMTGAINVGTHEYLEQYGINPHMAIDLAKEFIMESEKLVQETKQQGKYPTIELLYSFLDRMYDNFKEEYKRAMKRLGLKTLISEDFLFLEDKGEEVVSDSSDTEEDFTANYNQETDARNVFNRQL